MRESSLYRLLVSTFAMAGLVLAIGLAGCDEDEPAPTPDVGVDSGPKVDQMLPDKQMWPKPDLKPDAKPDTGYKKGAFGCSSDSDCFGQKCCPTPWGVKLCAPSCDLNL